MQVQKIHTAKHTTPNRFGWDNHKNAPADNGVVTVQREDFIVKNFHQHKPINKNYWGEPPGNFKRNDKYASPAQPFVEQIATMLRREGDNFTDVPGFAYIVTPFEAVGNNNFALARLFAYELIQKLLLRDPQVYSRYGESNIDEFQMLDLLQNDKRIETVGQETAKEPHFDGLLSRVMALVIGPQKNIEGGCSRISDPEALRREKKIKLADFYDQKEMSKYGTFEVLPQWQPDLLENHTITFSPQLADGMIPILVLNNKSYPQLDQLYPQGIQHGATEVFPLPGTRVIQGTIDAERYLYRLWGSSKRFGDNAWQNDPDRVTILNLIQAGQTF